MMLTREQFIEAHRHELGGMIMDACTPRDGAHAAMFVRAILKKIDSKLGIIYDQLCPAKPLPVNVNGKTTAPVGQTSRQDAVR